MRNVTTFVMTPEHPEWPYFCGGLIRAIKFKWMPPSGMKSKCKGGLERPQARKLLAECGADVQASLDYFEQNGGHCDCEIIMNVEPYDDQEVQ